jgi:uncharacterized protein (TIGR02996 family)
MSHSVKATIFLEELKRDGLIEVRRVPPIARELGQELEQFDRCPSGLELEEWLEEHRLVQDLVASTRELDSAAQRHFADLYEVVIESARHPELEQHIAEQPDAIEPYLVYSDWLQERADPFGQLIALGITLANSRHRDDKSRLERFLKKYRDHFWAEAQPLIDSLELSWQVGMVSTITAQDWLPAQAYETLLQRRICSFLQNLDVLVPRDPEQSAELIATIDEHAPQTLRSLALRACVGVTLPASILERKRLRALEIEGSCQVPKRIPANIERVALRMSPADDETSFHRPIAATWHVRKLDLAAISSQTILALLRSIRLPELETLTITRTTFSSLEQLEDLPIAGQLKSLTLRYAGLTDAAFKSFDAQRFAKLERLDLSFNHLTAEALSRDWPFELIAGNQRPHDPPRYEMEPASPLRQFAGSRFYVAQDIADSDDWLDEGVDGDNLWATYQGGDRYDLYVARELGEYGCTCPSRIQPCKHVVALAMRSRRGLLEEKANAEHIERVRTTQHYQSAWE